MSISSVGPSRTGGGIVWSEVTQLSAPHCVFHISLRSRCWPYLERLPQMATTTIVKRYPVLWNKIVDNDIGPRDLDNFVQIWFQKYG